MSVELSETEADGRAPGTITPVVRPGRLKGTPSAMPLSLEVEPDWKANFLLSLNGAAHCCCTCWILIIGN